MKEKIAISLTKEVLEQLDKRIDGSTIRSRSQAIEIFLKKGLISANLDTAFIMLSEEHSDIPNKPFKTSTVLQNQTAFLKRGNINRIYIITPADIETDKATIIKTKARANADALKQAKSITNNPFVVMSGDTYHNFYLGHMIEKHKNSGKLATVGLMSSPFPVKYGTAVLEGDLVTDFREKPKNPESHIINSGIYIFNPGVFPMLKGSIERNLLPELAKKRQLAGYFTSGEYVHFGEKM